MDNTTFKLSVLLVSLMALLTPLLAKNVEEVSVNAVIERVVEMVSERFETEDYAEKPDLTVLYDNLRVYYSNPINLNTTTKEELEQLLFLSDIQIENLLYYRYRAKEFNSVYELVLVDDLDDFTIELLMPFVEVDSSSKKQPKWDANEIARLSKHYVMTEMSGIMQPSKGYLSNKENQDLGYLGDPINAVVRYRFSSKDRIEAGITMSKDAGEPFWNKYNKGFDSYALYVQLSNLWHFKRIVVGDFRASFGQGLVMYNGFRMGKSSMVVNTTARAAGLQRKSSSDEYNYFRGVGATFSYKDFEITALYSYRNYDADTTNGDYFTSFRTTGYHRTISEIGGKNSVSQQVVCVNLNYNHPYFSIGATGYYSYNSLPQMPTERPYNVHYFRGQRQGGVGVNYATQWKWIRFVGETAISHVNAIATLNTITFTPFSNFNFSVLHRYYSPKYHLYFANGFRENTLTNNENGFYFGVELKPISKLKISAYLEAFNFPWIKNGVSEPNTNGTEVFTQIDYKASDIAEMYGRIKYETKIRYDSLYNKLGLRYQLKFSLLNGVALKTTLEGNLFQNVGGKLTTGMVIAQDAFYKIEKINLVLNARYEFFEAQNYNNRIYLYENNTPYTFYSPMLYGVGNRFYLNIKYSILPQLAIYFRIAQTYYFDDREGIGSGNDYIKGDSRTELKGIVELKF